MATDGQHCSFVLLSEFDIDLGPKLTFQFPQPLGVDESLLANLMLPDGAEKQLEDWTIFFLNQTPFNAIAPVLALEQPVKSRVSVAAPEDGSQELLYVLNLVRTKHDKSVKRGAVVKAMAICTRHPFIQIFKPVLLMALDDYYADPSQDCLARLFDAINSIDLSAAPRLSWHEKLVLRASDRKDIFSEKFAPPREPGADGLAVPGQGSGAPVKGHRPTPSWESRASTEEHTPPPVPPRDPPAAEPAPSLVSASPRESFALDGSAAWAEGDSAVDASAAAAPAGANAGAGPSAPANLARKNTLARGRRDTDSSSVGRGGDDYFGGAPAPPVVKDTHTFQTHIAYKGHTLPIKMPVSTFPEEVGDYSLIQLISTFTSPTAIVTGPLHPHLHSNGALTSPVIIMFNALVTAKRILFLGHNRPAGQVSSYVLAACALGSGCGAVLRGFISRAFPYANLLNKEEWESIPGYIAGVTNPIFESFDSWDVLCDVGSGRITVARDILSTYPPTPLALSAHSLVVRSGTLKSETSVASEEELGRMPAPSAVPPTRAEASGRADSTDNLFIEDIVSAIQFHFGENLVRARFQEYVLRFVRVAARYEEETRGATTIGYASRTATPGVLGAGIVFADEASGARELGANAPRVEEWIRTPMYEDFQQDFAKNRAGSAFEGVDVAHQLWRLRHARNMPDVEVELILRTFAEQLTSYTPVVELLAHMSSHQQGLLPLSFGLFHPQEQIRELTVDIFNALREYPVGVHFLNALNQFQRYAFVRQAAARETRVSRFSATPGLQPGLVPGAGAGAGLYPPPPAFGTRTPSNRSEASLVGAA